MWIIQVLIYGLLKGFRDITKKLALKRNSVIEVLLVYTVIGFLICVLTTNDPFGFDNKFILPIALKSLFVFLAWIFSFKAISNLPVSLVGVLDLSRVLFSTTLGVFVLKEVMSVNQIIGMILVCLGLLFLKLVNSKKSDKEDIKSIYIIICLASCLLNASSGLMDKLIMRTGEITSSQLQFWYMGLMVIYYVVYAGFTKQQVRVSSIKNIWIWFLALSLVVADRVLFMANADPNSKVTIMTLLKQASVIVTIIGGKYIFKEKNIIKKTLCALIIVMGIVIATI